MRIKGIVALVLLVVAVVVVGGLVATAWRALDSSAVVVGDLLSALDTPANPDDGVRRTFVVKQGDSATMISERLRSEGLINSSTAFRLMAEAGGVAQDLAAGEYDLSPNMRPSEILFVIARGKTKPGVMVTFPEGWRAEEVAERLAARGIGTNARFMEYVRRGDSRLASVAGRPPGSSLEGYLFPDTYAMDSTSTPENVADRMVDLFDQKFTPDMRQKASALGMPLHEIVTLASVIEREAVMPSERPLMAGVFYNRFKAGMPLQTDPTVQYALASSNPDSQKKYGWWKTFLTADDLQIDSPYNTYRVLGLPPGPICNPGLASLLAALRPASTSYLYFVARPDGSHAFADTLEQHNANVFQYRR